MAGGSRRWGPLPPRPISWAMRSLASATFRELLLPDGRVQMRLEHELLEGITAPMLAWWFRNIDAEMDLEGHRYHRYLIWHPVDHIHFRVVRRVRGSVGAGARFHIVEAFGGDPKYLMDHVADVAKLDEDGVVLEMRRFGQAAARLHHQFVPAKGGTRYRSTLTLGLGSWLGQLGLNRYLRSAVMPPDMRAAWIKHNVEEVGNLRFFLPQLYRHETNGASA